METDPEVSLIKSVPRGKQEHRQRGARPRNRRREPTPMGGGLVLNRRRGRSCSKTGWKKVKSCDELVEGDRSTVLASLPPVGSRFSWRQARSAPAESPAARGGGRKER